MRYFFYTFFFLFQTVFSLTAFSQSISLTTESLSHHAILITFSAAPASGYSLMRKSVSGIFQNIATISAGQSTYTDTAGLTPDTPYEYKLTLIGAESEIKKEFTRPKQPDISQILSACFGTSGKITFTGEHTSQIFKVYTDSVSGTDIGDGSNIFFTPALTAQQTFYVTALGNLYESKPRKSFIVNVLPYISAAITGDTLRTFCQGSAILTAENPGTGAKISWFSEGVQVGGDSLNFRPTTSGTYHIQVEKDSCVFVSGNVRVIILPKPTAEIIEGEDILICNEGYISARTSEGATYSWLNENNTVIGTGEKLSITTDIFVRLRVSLNGCQSTTSLARVRFRMTPENPEPYCNKNLICEGESLVLTTKKNLTAEFFWTSPTGTRYEGREAVIKHADSLASGAYILTTNRDGCKRFDTLMIKFSPLINFLAEVKNPVCYEGNDGLIKIHSVSGAIIKATVGEKTLSGTQFIFDNLSKGIYEIVLENEDKCQKKLIFTLSNPPKPEIEAGEDITTSVFLPVNLNAEGSGVLFIWSPSEGLSANNILNPVANPKQSTLYTLRVIDEKGCEALDSVWVNVITELIPPKILTPNEDKNNDLWAIAHLEYFPDNEVTIWNRWGQEVFYEKNYQNKWDGTKDGQKLPEGAYYYLIKIAGGEMKKAGTLNILR